MREKPQINRLRFRLRLWMNGSLLRGPLHDHLRGIVLPVRSRGTASGSGPQVINTRNRSNMPKLGLVILLGYIDRWVDK